MTIPVFLAITMGLLVMDSISFVTGMAMEIATCENKTIDLSYLQRSFDHNFVANRPVCNNSDLLLKCSCIYWPAEAIEEPINFDCLKTMKNTILEILDKINLKLEEHELEILPAGVLSNEKYSCMTIYSTCSFNYSFEFSTDCMVLRIVCNCSTTQTSRPPSTTVSSTVFDTTTGIHPTATRSSSFGNTMTSTESQNGTSFIQKTGVGLIVGIVVGVAGAVILVAAILLFIFIRRRRARPNQSTNPAVTEKDGHSSKYNAYTTVGPALPASAPYDNLTISKEPENGKPYGSAPVYIEITSTATGTQATENHATNCGGDNALDRTTDAQKGRTTVADYDNSLQPSVPLRSDNETTLIENCLYGK